MRTPAYLNPKNYTLTAIILGYLMIGDYTANQQNAIGNWLITIGQILEGNSAIQQALQEYVQNNNNNPPQNGPNPFAPNINIFNNLPDEQEIRDIKHMLQDMIDKLDSIKK